VAFGLLVLVGLRPVERLIARFRVRRGITPESKQEFEEPEPPKR
jgi:hypothetical protein